MITLSYGCLAGEGARFRSEAVAVEVDVKERLSKLDLELPPSATLHRQKLASDLHTYHLLNYFRKLDHRHTHNPAS